MDRFTATPDPVTAGNDLEICFTNTGLANTTITVDLNNGSSQHTAQVHIDLDANGHGCVSWPVPATGWPSVVMEHSTSDDHAVVVV